MEAINIIFIAMSICVLFYIGYLFKSKKRVAPLIELIFAGAYGFVLFIFAFPNFLRFVERFLGIPSAINFFMYLAMFFAYLLILGLYHKTEKQRQEVSKLNQEVAIKKAKKP